MKLFGKYLKASLLLAICIFCNEFSSSAQQVVGKRDYLQWVGGSRISANTLCHYTLDKATTLFLDAEKKFSFEMPADAIVVRTLFGVNKYTLKEMTVVYNNLFVYSVKTSTGWQHYMPFTDSEKDNDKHLVARMHICLSWRTDSFDPSMPSEAEITYIVEPADKGHNTTTKKHVGVSFTRTSITFDLGEGEKTLTSLDYFYEKLIQKQVEKSRKMLESYGKKKSMEPAIDVTSDFTLFEKIDLGF